MRSLATLLLVFLQMPLAHAEHVGTVVYDYLPAKQAYALAEALNNVALEGDHKLTSIDVYILPRENGPGSPETFNLHLIFEGGTLDFSAPTPHPKELSELPAVHLDVSEISLEKLKESHLVFDVETAFYKIVLNFDGVPICDFVGPRCSEQVDKLAKLAEFELYSEGNLKDQFIAIRVQAAKDLAQYPTQEAIDILYKVAQYDGVWVDYDLRSQAWDSLRALIFTLRQTLVEVEATAVLEEMYQNYEITQGWIFVLDEFAKFKTSAPLFFFIKNHFYSPGTDGVTADKILSAIYQRADFASTVATETPHILKDIIEREPKDAPDWWAQDRACEAFTLAPQRQAVRTLITLIFKTEDFSVASRCSQAVIAAMNSLDLNPEVADLEGQMLAELSKSVPIDAHNQMMAVYVLMEINDSASREVLAKVVKDHDMSDELRQTITDFLKL